MGIFTNTHDSIFHYFATTTHSGHEIQISRGPRKSCGAKVRFEKHKGNLSIIKAIKAQFVSMCNN